MIFTVSALAGGAAGNDLSGDRSTVAGRLKRLHSTEGYLQAGMLKLGIEPVDAVLGFHDLESRCSNC